MSRSLLGRERGEGSSQQEEENTRSLCSIVMLRELPVVFYGQFMVGGEEVLNEPRGDQVVRAWQGVLRQCRFYPCRPKGF